MRIVVLDTETTGVGENDRVIQIASICVDENFTTYGASNTFCNVATVIPSGAIAVHQIDNRKLELLSGNKFIEDQIYDIRYLANAKDTIFIGYNISFDIKMINNSLVSEGYEPIDFGVNINVIPRDTKGRNYNLCLMRTLKDYVGYKGKWKKLTKMREDYIQESDAEILEIKNAIIDTFKLSKGLQENCIQFEDEPKVPETFHDALYDTLVTLLLFKKFQGMFVS